MPFRILIAGDFAGSASQRPAAPIEIDRDSFDAVLGRVRPAIELPIAGVDGRPVSVAVRELDDLHPDRLWRSLPIFEAIRATAAPDAQPAPPRVQRASLLDDIVAGTAEAHAAAEGDPWNQALRTIATRHAIPKETPEQARRGADARKAAELLMAAILHSAPFRAVEAAWRGLDLTVRRVETSEDVKIFIADVSKTRLQERLADFGDGWSVVLGNFTFGPSDPDLRFLSGIARAAAQAQTPFVAAAHPSLAGCDENQEMTDARDWKRLPAATDALWRELRRSPDAAWLGLAFPRFLIRLPYGEDLASCDEFHFEETLGNFSRRDFAWANPVFAVAAMLGESAAEFGGAGAVHSLEDMPVCSWRPDGEMRFQAAGEVVLTDRAAEAALERGFIPLLSAKHGNAIRAPRFQSIADPPLELEFPEP